LAGAGFFRCVAGLVAVASAGGCFRFLDAALEGELAAGCSLGGDFADAAAVEALAVVFVAVVGAGGDSTELVGFFRTGAAGRLGITSLALNV